MTKQEFHSAVENLVELSPSAWLDLLCNILIGSPSMMDSNTIVNNLPKTTNPDLNYLASQVIRIGGQLMSWEAVGRVLETSKALQLEWQSKHGLELLWSGPTPERHIAARRVDQTLYDLISDSKHDVLLITFAAAKIQRLAATLVSAIERKVRVRLILEFAHWSEGQLSYDALNAFPKSIIDGSEIYYWPKEKRERNQAGKPGKLHAKAAIVDDVAVISSANLTDDAFSRNMELGVLSRSPLIRNRLEEYIYSLISSGVLAQIKS